MAHGLGHCHCAHEKLVYCGHCDVAYCDGCKREWGLRLGGWTWYSPYSSATYTLNSAGQTNATSISTTSPEGHTHG